MCIDLRLVRDLHDAEEKFKPALEQLTPEQLAAQAKELFKVEALTAVWRTRLTKQYKNCVNKRANDLPITKFIYRIDSHK